MDKLDPQRKNDTTLVMDIHGRRWQILLLHATDDQRCVLDRINGAHTGFSSIWVCFLPTFKTLLV